MLATLDILLRSVHVAEPKNELAIFLNNFFSLIMKKKNEMAIQISRTQVSME